MRHVLYINDTPSSNYGIYIDSDTYLSAPQIDYTAYQVPARNGDLVQYNKRLNNVVRHFRCFIPKNVQANLDGFKKLLYSNIGYLKIASDYDPEVYQFGYLAEGLTAEPFRMGDALQVSFDLYFSCQPQRVFTDLSQISRTFGATVIKLVDARNSLVRFVRRNTQIEFESSNIGWAADIGTNYTFPAGSGTVSLRAASGTVGTYALVAVAHGQYDDASKWQFLGATSNSDLEVTLEEKSYSQDIYAVTTAQPRDMVITIYDEDEMILTPIRPVSWYRATLSNNNAMGSDPVIALKMQIGASHAFRTNYLCIDDTFITFDMEGLVTDLGDAFFLANYTVDDYFLLVVDAKGGNVWVTKSSDLADYETVDLSINNYVQIIEGGEHGDTIDLASAYSGSGNVVRPVEVGGNAGWWKL